MCDALRRSSSSRRQLILSCCRGRGPDPERLKIKVWQTGKCSGVKIRRRGREGQHARTQNAFKAPAPRTQKPRLTPLNRPKHWITGDKKKTVSFVSRTTTKHLSLRMIAVPGVRSVENTSISRTRDQKVAMVLRQRTRKSSYRRRDHNTEE